MRLSGIVPSEASDRNLAGWGGLVPSPVHVFRTGEGQGGGFLKELERWVADCHRNVVADCYRKMGAISGEDDVLLAGNQIDAYVEMRMPSP